MTQGVERNKEEVLEILKPIFKLGYSLRKACLCAGIPESTVRTWVDADDDLRAKVTAWQNEPNMKARKNIVSQLDSGNIETSKWWTERKEKDEFCLKNETGLTDKDGNDVNLPDIIGESISKIYGKKAGNEQG